MKFLHLVPALSSLLLASLVAGDKLVTSSDGVEHILPDIYEDRDITIPSGEVITLRFWGNITFLPGPALAPPPPPPSLKRRRAQLNDPTASSNVKRYDWVGTGGQSDQCGNEGQWSCNTSGGSPSESDCQEMGYSVGFNNGYWRFTPSDMPVGNYRTIVTRGSCAFGFGLSVTACNSVNLGNQDVRDLIRDSSPKCASGGRLGSKGDQLFCRSEAQNQGQCWTRWAIYHS